MTIYTTIKYHSVFQKYALLLSLKDWEIGGLGFFLYICLVKEMMIISAKTNKNKGKPIEQLCFQPSTCKLETIRRWHLSS